MTNPVDITQALKDTENALRDFIGAVLSQKLGMDWIEKSGATAERIQKWKERKEVEGKRQEAGAVDERLIYYADFYDLKAILKQHWQHFSDALGDLKTFEVWLTELEKLRDPDAHRRELLPHQKHLALGIEGEIRTRIVRYRSRLETSDDYYARIESARDNYGLIYVPERQKRQGGVRLRPGDKLEWLVTARDPMGASLEFRFSSEPIIGRAPLRSLDSGWVAESNCSYVLHEIDVDSSFNVTIAVRSPRKFHAHGDTDDLVMFFYEVLPPRQLA